MSETKRQRSRERIARICDQIAGGRSDGGNQLRSTNRRIEKRKGRSATPPNEQ